MSAFWISVVVVQCVLIFALFATVAQLLVRVRSTEQLLSAMVNPFAEVPPLVLGEPLVESVAADLGALPDRVELHVVSAECTSCRSHVASLPASADAVVVVADATDLSELAPPDGLDTRVSARLVYQVRSAQLPLPVVVELDGRTVRNVRGVGHDTPTHDSGGSR